MVLSAAVALALQSSHSTPWAVLAIRDLKRPRSPYEAPVADLLSNEVAEGGAHDVVRPERARWAGLVLGISPVTASLADAGRIAERLSCAVFVRGEIVDYRVWRTRGGKRAQAALRVVVYSTAWDFPLNATMESGAADSRGRKIADEALAAEALSNAVELAVRSISVQHVPTARIVDTKSRAIAIDGGSRAGFKTKDRILVSRGVICTARGHIVRCEPDKVEIVLEGIVLGLASGDKVQAAIEPPPLPGRGESVFDSPTEHGMGRSTRRPWWRRFLDLWS